MSKHKQKGWVRNPNGNPNISEVGLETRYKALDGLNTKLGSKVFSIRLPIAYEKVLLSLSQADKVSLIRSAIMNAIDDIDN